VVAVADAAAAVIVAVCEARANYSKSLTKALSFYSGLKFNYFANIHAWNFTKLQNASVNIAELFSVRGMHIEASESKRNVC